MIAFRGIRKSYGPLAVLRDLDLTIVPSAITAIVGPNGAGKSTLIKLLLGLVRADAGTISFNGRMLDGDAEYRHDIGYMPQRACFPENLDGAHVLQMLRNLRAAEVTDDSLIDVFGIRGELNKPVRTLSGGTRQKLNAAAAFLFKTPLLVLDEPTAGLDPVASGQFKDRILHDRAEGRTVLLTSHNTADLEELADTIVFILDGTVRFAGTPRELLQLTGELRLGRAFAALMQNAQGVTL
ncbi:MAG TPA: ABC transporter ATP-binding protein [Longimicrobiales bacterium]|nr:ABC transporter ATP-binding protein [Longimicrobiales bacterium]